MSIVATVLLVVACRTDVASPTEPRLTWSGPTEDPFTIRNENVRGGDSAWFTTSLALQTDLAMWAAPYVVNPGDTLDVYLNGRAGTVRLSLYRLGWYRGVGGRKVWTQTGISVSPQPACSAPFPGPVSCPWARATRAAVPATATSGIYLLKATDSLGMSALYPFVVRSKYRTMFTAVVPQLTWQAYNAYGGSSFYTKSPDGTLGHLVSFERPYDLRGGAGYLYGPGYSNEISVLFWLEREGYDVSYVSDADVAQLGSKLPPPEKGLLFIGHDEYWTLREFDTTRWLRDAGAHLAFFAGNAAYWRVRLGPGPVTGRPGAVVECFKSDPDPAALRPEDRTTLFRSLGRPENALVGTGYVQHAYGGPYHIVGADSGTADADLASMLRTAGISSGDTLAATVDRSTGEWPTSASLEGNEVLQNGATPSNLQVLFRLPYTGGVKTKDGVFETTFYRSSSGAGVFSTGLNEWGRFLSGRFGPEDPKLSATTRVVLDWMVAH